jgi:type VI protein secretion system component Hcp
MQATNIDGTSQQEGYLKWIPLTYIDFPTGSASVDRSIGAATIGQPSWGDVTFTKPAEASDTLWVKKAANADKIDKIEVVILAQGGGAGTKPRVQCTMKMEDIIVTSTNVSAMAEMNTDKTYSLNYARIHIEWNQYDDENVKKGADGIGYDRITKKDWAGT